MPDTKVEYVEVSLDEVTRFFSQNFKTQESSKLQCLDTYVDSGKNKVIFKMLTTPILTAPNTNNDLESGD